jgi:hypothetical protein
MQNEPTIVTNWDSMPPEVYAYGEVFSTRVLAMRYQKMKAALEEIAGCTVGITDPLVVSISEAAEEALR